MLTMRFGSEDWTVAAEPMRRGYDRAREQATRDVGSEYHGEVVIGRVLCVSFVFALVASPGCKAPEAEQKKKAAPKKRSKRASEAPSKAPAKTSAKLMKHNKSVVTPAPGTLAEKPLHNIQFRIGKTRTRYFWKRARLASRIEVTNITAHRARGNLCVVLLDERGEQIRALTRHGLNMSAGHVEMVELGGRVEPKLWRLTRSLHVMVARYNCPGTDKNRYSDVVATTPTGAALAETPGAKAIDWPFRVLSATATYNTSKTRVEATVEIRADARAEGTVCVALVDKDGFKTDFVRVGDIALRRTGRKTLSATRGVSAQSWSDAVRVDAFVASGGCGDYATAISEPLAAKRK